MGVESELKLKSTAKFRKRQKRMGRLNRIRLMLITNEKSMHVLYRKVAFDT